MSTSWRGVWNCLNRACWLSGCWCFGTWGLAGPGKDAPCRASQFLDGKRLPRARSSNANQLPWVLPHHFLPWALTGLSPCPYHLRARPQTTRRNPLAPEIIPARLCCLVLPFLQKPVQALAPVPPPLVSWPTLVLPGDPAYGGVLCPLGKCGQQAVFVVSDVCWPAVLTLLNNNKTDIGKQ